MIITIFGLLEFSLSFATAFSGAKAMAHVVNIKNLVRAFIRFSSKKRAGFSASSA